jgi:hypothetical protein
LLIGAQRFRACPLPIFFSQKADLILGAESEMSLNGLKTAEYAYYSPALGLLAFFRKNGLRACRPLAISIRFF